MAQILNILERVDQFGPANLNHFKLEAGEQIDLKIVLENEHISLYCIDHSAQRLIFTDLPADVDLTTVPFVYAAQKEKATRLIALSYEEVFALTQDIHLPEQIILIYSTGRAGSTLMSQILSEVDNVVSHSEPDVFLNLVPIIYHTEERTAHNSLVEACFKLWGYHHRDKTLAIKFRGECIDSADVFQQVLPQAKNLYLYRQTIQWASSWKRIWSNFGVDQALPVDQATFYGDLFNGRNTTLEWVANGAKMVTIPEMLMSLWLFYLEAYYRMVDLDIPFMAVRYQDLNQHRDVMLTKVFEYVGLPLSELESALQGFDRDSQAGTLLERKDDRGNTETVLDEEVESIKAILARHSLQLTPDTILPNTVNP